jgi:hypothetical protein
MRVKNKEIRSRRHRKEQKIKDAARETRALYANKESAPKAIAAAPAKPASKPAAKAATKAASKESPAKEAKPAAKKAPAKKKEESTESAE